MEALDQYVVVVGNPIDGIMIYGYPFITGEEASEWAELHIRTEPYWVTRLVSPGSLEKLVG
jgi:hypothetical protein